MCLADSDSSGNEVTGYPYLEYLEYVTTAGSNSGRDDPQVRALSEAVDRPGHVRERLLSTLNSRSKQELLSFSISCSICVNFLFFQRVYVACARQIKRIDAVKRSPIYAFFSETLAGVSSIRAYNVQDRFIKHSDQLLDDSQRVWFEVFTSNR